MKKIIITAAFSMLAAGAFAQNALILNNGGATTTGVTPTATATVAAPGVTTAGNREKTLNKDIKADEKNILTEINSIRADIKNMRTDIRQRKADIKDGDKAGVIALTKDIKKDRAEIRADKRQIRRDLRSIRLDVRAEHRIARHEHHLHHIAAKAAHKVAPVK